MPDRRKQWDTSTSKPQAYLVVLRDTQIPNLRARERQGASAAVRPPHTRGIHDRGSRASHGLDGSVPAGRPRLRAAASANTPVAKDLGGKRGKTTPG